MKYLLANSKKQSDHRDKDKVIKVQSNLYSITDFCQKLQIRISVNKCQVLTFYGGQNDENYPSYLFEYAIPNVGVVRFLLLRII